MRRLSILLTCVLVTLLAGGQDAKGDLSDNLLAYYPFQGNADDFSGNDQDGTVYGAILTTDRFGKLNSAYHFDGLNDYIDCGSALSTAFDAAASFTLEAWIKYLGMPTFGAVVARHDDRSGTFNYAMGVASSRPVFVADQAHKGSCWLVSDDNLTEDVWYHLVNVYDNKSMTIFINGREESTASFSYSGAGDVSANLLIGKTGEWPGYPDNRYFRGDIDGLAIYDRALTATEVSNLYIVPVPGSVFVVVLGPGHAAISMRRKRPHMAGSQGTMGCRWR